MWLKSFVAILLFIIVLPILLMIGVSFTDSGSFSFPPRGISLRWYGEVLSDPAWLLVAKNSLVVGVISALVATVLGVMAAVASVQFAFPGKFIFVNLIMAPMAMPVIIVALALFYVFSRLQLTDTIPGLVIAHSIIGIPFVFITVRATLEGFDQNLQLAAQNLGSSPVGAFFRVTIPSIKSSIVAGFIFAFALSFDEVIIGIFLTGPATKTLPIRMWEYFTVQLTPAVAAISTLLVVLVAGTFLLFPRLITLGGAAGNRVRESEE